MLEEPSPRRAAGRWCCAARVDAARLGASPGTRAPCCPASRSATPRPCRTTSTQAMRDAGLDAPDGGLRRALHPGRRVWSLGLAARWSGLPRALRVARGAGHGSGFVLLVHPTPERRAGGRDGRRRAARGCCWGVRPRAPAGARDGGRRAARRRPVARRASSGSCCRCVATAGLVLAGGRSLVERWSGALRTTGRRRPRRARSRLSSCARRSCSCCEPAVSHLRGPGEPRGRARGGARDGARPARGPRRPVVAGRGVRLSRLAGAACWWIGAVARGRPTLPGARVPWPGRAGRGAPARRGDRRRHTAAAPSPADEAGSAGRAGR